MPAKDRLAFLGRQRQHFAGACHFGLGGDAIAQFHHALAHGDDGVVVIGLDALDGDPSGGGHLGGHHAYLLKGSAWRTFTVKIDIVDVAGSTVAH